MTGLRASKVTESIVGLVLPGGGARAAYQVGVLKAIADMLPPRARNPFPVICGTSAGAINAVAVATHTPHFRAGIRGLEIIWRNFHANHIYETDFSRLSLSAVQWLIALFFAGIGARRPVSLLDNNPLRALLTRRVRFERIDQAIEGGDLRALAITTSSYNSGESVTFFQGVPELRGWRRARRVGKPARIRIDHLLASSAIPAIFPAVAINREYFGDGSVRHLAPISPALHLGANRILVIGVGEDILQPTKQKDVLMRPPSLAQIAGHLLDSAFLDTLEGDLERLQRINRTVSLIPEETRRRENVGLHPVEVLSISPSESLTTIAGRHVRELPLSMRFFMRGSGATKSSGSVVMSYLLFERGYCREVINLGYADALRQENRILRFLGHDPVALHGAAAQPQRDIW
ncbi:MAG: patatin-like phospholipase family protein [Nitrococcus sp.]|nr:patatin-like phospholipase family protein [Nitrococcus sp.]